MNKTVIKTPRSLAKLTPMIRKELKAGFDAGQRHWQIVGRLLNEAREHFPKSGPNPKGLTFHQWVADNFQHPLLNKPLSKDAANTWMRAVKGSVRGTTEPISLMEATNDSRHPKSESYNPKLDWERNIRKVQKTVNVDQLRKQLATEREQARERDALARKIVDAGFRALSAVVHPDRPGGSKEAMKKLTETKNWLQEQIRRGS